MANHSFKDANGATYNVRVTFRTIFNVAEKTGLDILNPTVPGENGVSLEEELFSKPTVVVKIVAALCGVDDVEAFYDAIDGAAYKELEKAFWAEYLNFFVQSGRDYAATALRIDLEMKAKAEKQTEENLRKLQKKTSFSSSPSPASPTGKIKLSGNSTEQPTPISGKTVPTARKSSAPSITPTPKKENISGARPTSTITKKPAPKKKPKNS